MHIPAEHRETILESLADAVERLDSITLSSNDSDIIESYSTAADLFAGVEARVWENADLDEIDIDVVIDALDRSIEDCEDHAQAPYRAALDALGG